eukprot:534692-Amorphochlora_amoeboformis.AAC.1
MSTAERNLVYFRLVGLEGVDEDVDTNLIDPYGDSCAFGELPDGIHVIMFAVGEPLESSVAVGFVGPECEAILGTVDVLEFIASVGW